MSMDISVRVVDDEGNGQSGLRVTLDFGMMYGQSTEFTDDDGWANFEIGGDYDTCTIFIDGDNYGDHSVEDGESFSFVLE